MVGDGTFSWLFDSSLAAQFLIDRREVFIDVLVEQHVMFSDLGWEHENAAEVVGANLGNSVSRVWAEKRTRLACTCEKHFGAAFSSVH